MTCMVRAVKRTCALIGSSGVHVAQAHASQGGAAPGRGRGGRRGGGGAQRAQPYNRAKFLQVLGSFPRTTAGVCTPQFESRIRTLNYALRSGILHQSGTPYGVPGPCAARLRHCWRFSPCTMLCTSRK